MSHGKFAEKVWERNRRNIVNIVDNLKRKLNYGERETEDILNYVQFKFLQLYYDYYENDQQFMGYMYVVTKHIVFDLRRKDKKFLRKHISDPSVVISACRIVTNGKNNRHDDSTSYIRILGEMAEDKSVEVNGEKLLEYKELVARVKQLLENDIHVRIFELLLQSYKPPEITDIISRSISYVMTVRKKYIYPAVGQVLGLYGEEYEWHASSGRIYV